jgi:hypothetical protein
LIAYEGKDTKSVEDLFLGEPVVGKVDHALGAAMSTRNLYPSADSHDIRGALTPTALDGLQLSSELGAQDLEHESIRVLVDK